MAYLSGELSMDGGLKASVMSDATASAPRMHCIGSALQVAHTARAHDCGYLSILKYLGSICLHRIPAEDIPALASQARLHEKFHGDLLSGAAVNYARIAELSDCMLSCKLQEVQLPPHPATRHC